jgi:CRISPR-associated protein Csx17
LATWSVASAFPGDYPFALYRFGVEWLNSDGDGGPRRNSAYAHSKTAPARWVWRAGSLARNLGAVLQRRLLDWENERGAPPAYARITARMSDIEAWLDGNGDEALLARWLSRLALFDWSFDRGDIRTFLAFDNAWSPPVPVGSMLALYGLLHPLFDLRPAKDEKSGNDLFAANVGARTPAAARRIAALIRGGDIDRAVEIARSRYAMAHTPLMRTEAPCVVENPERLLAAFLFPASSGDRAVLVRRWVRPQSQAYEVTHA